MLQPDGLQIMIAAECFKLRGQQIQMFGVAMCFPQAQRMIPAIVRQGVGEEFRERGGHRFAVVFFGHFTSLAERG